MAREASGGADAAAGPAPAAPSLGVIDIGSNTARFVVFETSSRGTVRPVFEAKESPRLGHGTLADGSLSEEAIGRGLAAVRRFAGVAHAQRVARTLGVATSATRDAPNGPAFLKEIAKATGVELRVLSGAEEAQYAYLGVAGTWELANDVVCDLGGGSLQLAEVHEGALRNSVSLPLGALRLSDRFFEHDPPKRKEVDELREHVRGALTSAVEAFGQKPGRLVAVGGTVRALARASIALKEFPIRKVHGYTLYDRDIEALDELLGEMPAAKRRAVPGISADRADIVPAGLVVVEELERAFGVDRLLVSGAGIREGVALEAIGARLPATAEELVDRSIVAASETFRFVLEHGREVVDAALGLFDLVADRQHWGPSERKALRAAAGMHDAGTAVDLWNHALHSSYLVRNYPIWGLDQREVLLASMVTYLHEGDDPPSEWKKAFLPIVRGPELETAVALGALLETAEIVAAAHPKFALGGGGKTVAVTFSEDAELFLSSRWLEKARKPMRRAFDLELKVRDA